MLSLDLTQSSSWGQFLLTGGMGVACFFLFVLPLLREFLTSTSQSKPVQSRPVAGPGANSAKVFKRKGVDRSSDAPPPAGFADHLKIIEATAPNADATVWWEYAKNELTEAEVAIAEARLARKFPDEKSV